jgi:hypothetical protein
MRVFGIESQARSHTKTLTLPSPGVPTEGFQTKPGLHRASAIHFRAVIQII